MGVDHESAGTVDRTPERRLPTGVARGGAVVDTILAGHVFEYPRERDTAFPVVDGLREAVRVYIDETAPN